MQSQVVFMKPPHPSFWDQFQYYTYDAQMCENCLHMQQQINMQSTMVYYLSVRSAERKREREVMMVTKADRYCSLLAVQM